MSIHFHGCLITLALLAATPCHAQHWQRHVIDNFSSGADGVRIADVNGDGLPDITTGWEEGGFTKIYLHPGASRSRQSWPAVVVGSTPSVEDAVFADLDRDGFTDVISSTEGNNRKIYLHWAPNREKYLDSSQWETVVLPASEGLTQWMFTVPFNLDGQYGPDIVAGSKGKNAKIGWFESPADPRLLEHWIWHPISEATWIMSLILQDVNHDGYRDIVVSDRKPGITNGIRWLQHPGNASASHKSQTPAKQTTSKRGWLNHFIGAPGLEVMFIDLADIDGDGQAEVIACERSNNRILLFKKVDTSGLNWTEYPISIPDSAGLAKAVVAGDIDQDGKIDIVYSANTMGLPGHSGVHWLSYQQSPFVNNWKWHAISGKEGYKFDRLELLDLDRDGDLDVLTCEENFGADSRGLGVIWYENPRIQ